MPALAPGEARGLNAGSHRTRRAAWIRALRGLGFFVCAVALSACAPGDPHARALAEDTHYRTGAFTWLVDHDPARVVVWRVPAAQVADLIPDARVLAASSDAPCEQARTAHAALFLVAPRSAQALRDRAEDCGFALFRDGGALVIAPLPR